jgi:YHS domain-containing protein
MSTVVVDGFLLYFCNPKCKEEYLRRLDDAGYNTHKSND